VIVIAFFGRITLMVSALSTVRANARNDKVIVSIY
jgi:hypothetical protein